MKKPIVPNKSKLSEDMSKQYQYQLNTFHTWFKELCKECKLESGNLYWRLLYFNSDPNSKDEVAHIDFGKDREEKDIKIGCFELRVSRQGVIAFIDKSNGQHLIKDCLALDEFEKEFTKFTKQLIKKK